MMPRQALCLALCLLCLLPLAAMDSLASGGAGLHYLQETSRWNPTGWLTYNGDYFRTIGERLSYFHELRGYTVYDFSTEEFYALCDLAADLSYLGERLLTRWGLNADAEYLSGDPAALYTLGSHLLFSWDTSRCSLKLKPEFTYFSQERVLAEGEAAADLSVTLFDQLILSPGLGGGVSLVREGQPEWRYALKGTLDWYPLAAFNLGLKLAFTEQFSPNAYTLDLTGSALTLPDYFAYRELDGQLNCAWYLPAAASLSLESRATCRLMAHPALLLPELGTEAEWQCTLWSEVKYELPLGESLSLRLSADLLKVLSNSPYLEMSKAGGGVELTVSF